MSIIAGARSYYRLLGPRGLYVIARARLSRSPLKVAITHPSVAYPLHLRVRSTDMSLFEEIILHEEYLLESQVDPTVIVDAGANVGLTSVYFANRYPRARIIAIEPEAANYAVLVQNTGRYPNILPLRAALWKSDTELALEDPGQGSWGFQTAERSERSSPQCTVKALRLDTLMREQGLDHIDLLKVDIEGAEKEVFETSAAWIDRVGIVVVELHDRWKPGCAESVHGATRDFPIKWMRGETTFCFRSSHWKPEVIGIAPTGSDLTERTRTPSCASVQSIYH